MSEAGIRAVSSLSPDEQIQRLERWKDEALQVLAEWQKCYDILVKAGHPAPLGMSMARHVAGYLKIAVDVA